MAAAVRLLTSLVRPSTSFVSALLKALSAPSF